MSSIYMIDIKGKQFRIFQEQIYSEALDWLIVKDFLLFSFGLFLEDESYFESITNSQMYYLSALKCIENGQEEKSVVVEVAGRAELNPF